MNGTILTQSLVYCATIRYNNKSYQSNYKKHIAKQV